MTMITITVCRNRVNKAHHIICIELSNFAYTCSGHVKRRDDWEREEVS